MSNPYHPRRKAITIPCPACQPDANGLFPSYEERTLVVCMRCLKQVSLRAFTIAAGINEGSYLSVDPPLTCGHRLEDLRPAVLPCRCGGTGRVTVQVTLLESDEEPS